MANFAYNNSKNAKMGEILFKLNCGYYPWVSFKDKCNAYSRFSLANELAMKLRELSNVCCKNLLYVQDLQKWAQDKGVKLCSYALSEGLAQ